MTRARHRRPPSPPPPPPPPPIPLRRSRPKVQLRLMSTKRPTPKPKKRPPPWRKPESVEVSEEIRDLKRDIAIHSEPPSGANDGQSQAHDEQPRTRECDRAGPGKPTISWTRKRRPASSKKNVPWMKKYTVVDLSHEICDLERDNDLHPDFPANTSTRDARALSRAAGRIARVEASQVREARKPQKLARKQQQRYREGQRRASKMAPPQKPSPTEAPIMPEIAAGRRTDPLQRQPEVIDLTGED